MTPEQSMKIHLVECSLHADVLEDALDDAEKSLILSVDAPLGKESLRILDQIAYRFAKLQDSMGAKVLPMILELAQEPISSYATFSEKLNSLERIGAIPSAEEWKNLRAARNAVAHEYPDDPELRIGAIKRFLTGARQLSGMYRFVSRYVSDHFQLRGEIEDTRSC